MVAVLSFAVTSVIVVFLWQKAPSGGLITQMEGYELTEAQIDTNIAFYAFADLAFVFAPFLSVFYVSFLVLIEPIIGKLLTRSEEHTSELQSRFDLVCRLLLEIKKIIFYLLSLFF